MAFSLLGVEWERASFFPRQNKRKCHKVKSLAISQDPTFMPPIWTRGVFLPNIYSFHSLFELSLDAYEKLNLKSFLEDYKSWQRLSNIKVGYFHDCFVFNS